MRRVLAPAFKFAVSAALLYLALRKADFGALGERLGWHSAGWLVGAIAVQILQLLFAAVRWVAVSEPCGAPITLSRAFRYNMIGMFFNQTLPSSIGGDAVRLWLLARHSAAGWRAAAYSVFVDRALGLIALAILILLTLPFSLRLIDDEAGRIALIAVDGIALAIGFGFLAFGALRWRWIGTIAPLRHVHSCARVANRTIFTWRGLPLALSSIAIHVHTTLIMYCCARAIDAPVSFMDIFLLTPPVALITMLPISIAGWGVREAALGQAFSFAGLAASEGINVSLVFGAVCFLVGALGGLVWITSAEKAEKGAASMAPPV